MHNFFKILGSNKQRKIQIQNDQKFNFRQECQQMVADPSPLFLWYTLCCVMHCLNMNLLFINENTHTDIQSLHV